MGAGILAEVEEDFEMTRAMIQAKAALEQLGVVYQDDRLGQQERWKPFRFDEATFTLHYLGTKHVLHEWEKEWWQNAGFFTCIYGVFFRQPCDLSIATQVRNWTCYGGSNRSSEEFTKLFSNPFTIPNPQACAVLGLAYPFTHEQLKVAYKSAVKQHHPDAGGASEEFLLVQAAYEELSVQVRGVG